LQGELSAFVVIYLRAPFGSLSVPKSRSTQGGVAGRKAMIDRGHDLPITKRAEVLRIRSLADFITITSGFRFSVHTAKASWRQETPCWIELIFLTERQVELMNIEIRLRD